MQTFKLRLTDGINYSSLSTLMYFLLHVSYSTHLLFIWEVHVQSTKEKKYISHLFDNFVQNSHLTH